MYIFVLNLFGVYICIEFKLYNTIWGVYGKFIRYIIDVCRRGDRNKVYEYKSIRVSIKSIIVSIIPIR